MTCPVAFIDVDTQVDFMYAHGRLYVPGSERLVDNLRALTELSQRRGIPLVSSVDTHVLNDPEFTVYPPHCIRGTSGHRKVPETTVPNSRWVGMDDRGVAWRPGETLLVEKHVYSLFDNPNTPAILDQIGADEYVVYGVALDVCVRAAVLGLRKRGLKTTLVTDATRPVTEAGGAKALEEARAAGATFARTQEILERWDRDRP